MKRISSRIDVFGDESLNAKSKLVVKIRFEALTLQYEIDDARSDG